MNLLDYEKYYHSESEFIIPRDEFEKIIEENQRLNNALNELEKDIRSERNMSFQISKYSVGVCDFLIHRLNVLRGSDK